MLPGPGVRQRYRTPALSHGLTQIETVMSDSAVRYRRLPTRAKFCLVLSLVFSVVFYGAIVHSFLFPKDLSDESFLETDKCPACYGNSACTFFFYSRVKLSGLSKIRFLDFVNLKNVHYGVHEDKNVVIKKLAHDKELKSIDEKICADASREKDCDVARVIYVTNMAQTVNRRPLQPNMLKGYSPSMFTCPSYRLLDRVWHYYKERAKPDHIFFRDKIQLLYISMVNTEPLLLQTFPAKEGWPFPEYYGACGRYVMVENTGEPLSEFYNAPFEKRADLAYQILKIAEQLTNNAEKFAFYWTDVCFNNFVVDASGRVTVIDLENIIVVDKLAIEATKPKDWDELLEHSDDNDCKTECCLSIDTDNLCTRINADHNYYAACRNLFTHYANYPGQPGGLLHDMPQEAADNWDLPHLLSECVRPSVPQGRWKVKEKLLDALKHLRTNYEGDDNKIDFFKEKVFKPKNVSVVREQKLKKYNF